MRNTIKKIFTAFVFSAAGVVFAEAQNTFPATGNVGIGTTSPAVPLDVRGLSNFSQQLYSPQGYRVFSAATDLINGAPWYGIGHLDTSAFGTNIVQMAGFFGLYLRTSGAQMFLARSGNVGIGTTTPSATFHVLSTKGAGKDTATQYSGNLIVQANTAGRDINHGAALEFVIPANTDGSNPWGQGRILTVAGNTSNGNATGKMILGTRRSINKAGTGNQWYYGDDLTIDGNGYVGIGTATPGAALDIRGLSNFSEQLYSPKGYRMASSNTDLVYGCPWYGMGVIDSVSFGKQIVQTAGYFGLYFRTSGAQMLLTQSGNVGIGLTSNISEKLTVDGNVKAKEVIVTTSGWPDYVFKKDYKLPSLNVLSEQIKAEGHLPDMPSAAQVEDKGQNLGEMNKKLLQKVEELTLYLIEQKKQSDKQQQEIDALKKEVDMLSKQPS